MTYIDLHTYIHFNTTEYLYIAQLIQICFRRNRIASEYPMIRIFKKYYCRKKLFVYVYFPKL